MPLSIIVNCIFCIPLYIKIVKITRNARKNLIFCCFYAKKAVISGFPAKKWKNCDLLHYWHNRKKLQFVLIKIANCVFLHLSTLAKTIYCTCLPKSVTVPAALLSTEISFRNVWMLISRPTIRLLCSLSKVRYVMGVLVMTW